jgi:hypothetical protein
MTKQFIAAIALVIMAWPVGWAIGYVWINWRPPGGPSPHHQEDKDAGRDEVQKDQQRSYDLQVPANIGQQFGVHAHIAHWRPYLQDAPQ